MRKSSGEVGNGGERTEHRLAEFGNMVEVSEGKICVGTLPALGEEGVGNEFWRSRELRGKHLRG